eukprot:snap_masked-scaffold_5-processed-gene-19.24-mRNA-1 protein AED:1.00 eAED:1.00 QI:0/0/0/0/1/1/2/0/192
MVPCLFRGGGGLGGERIVPWFGIGGGRGGERIVPWLGIGGGAEPTVLCFCRGDGGAGVDSIVLCFLKGVGGAGGDRLVRCFFFGDGGDRLELCFEGRGFFSLGGTGGLFGFFSLAGKGGTALVLFFRFSFGLFFPLVLPGDLNFEKEDAGVSGISTRFGEDLFFLEFFGLVTFEFRDFFPLANLLFFGIKNL